MEEIVKIDAMHHRCHDEFGWYQSKWDVEHNEVTRGLSQGKVKSVSDPVL